MSCSHEAKKRKAWTASAQVFCRVSTGVTSVLASHISPAQLSRPAMCFKSPNDLTNVRLKASEVCRQLERRSNATRRALFLRTDIIKILLVPKWHIPAHSSRIRNVEIITYVHPNKRLSWRIFSVKKWYHVRKILVYVRIFQVWIEKRTGKHPLQRFNQYFPQRWLQSTTTPFTV